MITAIILSAGQGRRLLPLTEECPKCLLEVGNQSILAWQISTLMQAGIGPIHVVAGYNVDSVRSHIATVFPSANIHIIHNPFYEVADNLASCWMARAAMQDDFLIINGDTLFESALLDTLLHSPAANITLATDVKAQYDADDMKVELQAGRIHAVSKHLPPDQTHAESIGLLYFRHAGGDLFKQGLEGEMKSGQGLGAWFLSVINTLAGDGHVSPCAIDGKRWCEIDFPDDLAAARRLFAPACS